MDGVQLSQEYRAIMRRQFTFSSQDFLLLTYSTLEGWKVELILELPNGFGLRIPQSGIQHLNH